MINLTIIIFVICILYILLLRGRVRHPKLNDLRGWSYAHRGLHDTIHPENSMAAFRRALEAGYGMELDVHLMADGNLAVIHDSSLKRTAAIDKIIEDMTAEELPMCSLGGTGETIPLLTDVLKMVNGKVPLIVEIKSAGNNYAQVAEAVCQVLQNYEGIYCVESFDPRVIFYVRKHYPNFVRGQLAHNSLREESQVPWILRFLLTYDLLNFLVLPDFIAYRYKDRKTLSNFLCRKLWRIQGVSWTLTDRKQFQTAVKEGWIPIFENFEP